jgi:predicted ATPase
MLKRVYADNYRCLVNFEFHPQRINLLVGDNGSGKTCVFEVLEAIQDVVVLGDAVEETLPTSTLTRWDTRDVQRFELEIEGDGGTFLYVLEVEQDRKTSTAVIRREQVDFEGKPIFKYEGRKVHLYDDQGKPGSSFQADPRRSFLSILEERPESQRLMWFKRFIESLWILRLNPTLMTSVSKKEAQWLDRDGKNLASWYQRVAPEQPDAADALKADMREVIDGFQFFRHVSVGGTAKELFATYAIASGDTRKTYDISLDELSFGQRELFALYAILHMAVRRAKVLCFDEPDNFVALREIQPWLIKLSDAVEESGSQLLLISHHPEVIDYLAAGSAHKFERPGGDVVRVRPFEVDLDTGLKASEALARGWDHGQG